MKHFIVRNSFSLILIGLFLLFSITSLYKFGSDNSSNYVEITVSQGDTLWNIAEKYKDNNIGTPKFIAIIEKVNNLNGEVLKAGDVLVIPVKENHRTQLSMNQ
ncbi:MULTISPECIES: cell division suppressor protein YneA [Bacillus]|uniref:cell division suppressor protein YneA n=1 Tax=Bacillus TaxID=1386 RepID=UPI0002E0DC50|nr:MULTISPECIES: LysM peptidoglycan-binding domain-containing protein [Bacillus]